MTKTKVTLTNNEPLTWACECGQMNLLDDLECFECGGDKDDCWDEEDRDRAIWEETKSGPVIIGFRLDHNP
jgi:hypothetical protein